MDRVKRLVLVALFSDEDLTDLLVLKGGNALDIAYGIALRSSLDIDFSLPGEFILPLPQIRSKLEACLTSTFAHHDLTVFDVTLEARPKQVKGELAKFWGGYRAHFKVIEHSKYATLSGNVDELRKHAMMLGPNGRFQIEFSRHEYCAEKEIVNVDGTHISVYTPEMLVAEKLRAICQQMSEYARVVKSHPTSRARDFVDIVNLIDAFSIDMTLPAPRALIECCFAAKRVPLELLNVVSTTRDFHRPGFALVRDTYRPGARLDDFDRYFDQVSDLCGRLEPFWHK